MAVVGKSPTLRRYGERPWSPRLGEHAPRKVWDEKVLIVAPPVGVEAVRAALRAQMGWGDPVKVQAVERPEVEYVSDVPGYQEPVAAEVLVISVPRDMGILPPGRWEFEDPSVVAAQRRVEANLETAAAVIDGLPPRVNTPSDVLAAVMQEPRFRDVDVLRPLPPAQQQG